MNNIQARTIIKRKLEQYEEMGVEPKQVIEALAEDYDMVKGVNHVQTRS